MIRVGSGPFGEGCGGARLRGGRWPRGPVPPEGYGGVGTQWRCGGSRARWCSWGRGGPACWREGSQAGAAPPLLPALLQIVQQAAEGGRGGGRGPWTSYAAEGWERARRALRRSRRQRGPGARQRRWRHRQRARTLAPREREAAGRSGPARRLALADLSNKEVGAAARATHLRARLRHKRIRRLNRFETGWTEELHRRPGRGRNCC